MTDERDLSDPAREPSGEPKDELSPLAIGYAWATRVCAFSAEFVILAWFGSWIDRRYGTQPFGTLVGAAIGSAAFIAGLVSTAKKLQDEETRERMRAALRKKRASRK